MADDGTDLVVENDVMVPMRDGIRLRADVFRPASGGPHPVLVHRYPYSTRDGFMAMFGQQIAAQGYAVVVQSCRGRYGSEGDFYPFHPDVEDSYDTIEWAAAQPWSDGKVGMYGASYGGHDAVDRGHQPGRRTWSASRRSSARGTGPSAAGTPPPAYSPSALALVWSAADDGVRGGAARRRAADARVRRGGDDPRTRAPSAVPTRTMSELIEHAASTRARGRCSIGDHCATSRSCASSRRGSATGATTTTRRTPTGADRARPTTSRRSTCRSCTSPVGTTTSPRAASTPTPGCARYGRTEADPARGQRLVAGPWNHNGVQVRPDADPSVGMFFDFSPEAPVMRFFAHHLKGELPGVRATSRRSGST